MKIGAAALVIASCGFLASLEVSSPLADPPIGRQATVYRDVTVTRARRIEGHGVEWWRYRAVVNRRALNATRAREKVLSRRVRAASRAARLRYAPTVTLAVAYARAVYGVDQSGRVRCESHGDPYAQNASGAMGLLQFLPSTWRSTPFAGFSIFDPVAQSLAGGWMVTHGRSGEWTCRL